MNYRFLSEQLRPIAEEARRFFSRRWGVVSFKAEQSVSAEISFSPTLQAHTSDHHLLCIEVSEHPYPSTLDSFVTDCVTHSMPVLLYVAIPGNSKGENYNRDLVRAKNCGVGVLEVRKPSPRIIHQALPLSLLSVRPIELVKYPRKLRLPLSNAEETFKGGQPSKGCSLVYDEIEDLSRGIAKKSFAKGLWSPGVSPPRDFDKDPWQNVAKALMNNLDYPRSAPMKVDLLARVVGITPHRNDTAHKPKSLDKLLKRDNQLRTRFEDAADLLLTLVVAAKAAGLWP